MFEPLRLTVSGPLVAFPVLVIVNTCAPLVMPWTTLPKL